MADGRARPDRHRRRRRVIGRDLLRHAAAAMMLAAMGLSAWLAGADYIVIAALLAGFSLIGLGLYRRTAAMSGRDSRHS